MERSRREGRKPSKAANALAKLAELRKSGGRRVDSFELTEEATVYDELAEEDYSELVTKRREEGGELPIFRCMLSSHLVIFSANHRLYITPYLHASLN